MILLEFNIGRYQGIGNFLKYLGLGCSGCKSLRDRPSMTVDRFDRVRIFEENEFRFEAHKKFDA
jgi:hypothetical protein